MEISREISSSFLSFPASVINHRRQEHLACMGLDYYNKRVLEVGAGIGEFSTFFLDRGCKMVISDAREGNLIVLKERLASLGYNVEGIQIDLDNPPKKDSLGSFDIVFCYGTLYHLSNPEKGIKFMADKCTGLLLIETCVYPIDNGVINLCDESGNVTQSIHSAGCRPARSWVMAELMKYFKYVYVPSFQPNHGDFILDWVNIPKQPLYRTIFVASHKVISSKVLLPYLPLNQNYFLSEGGF